MEGLGLRVGKTNVTNCMEKGKSSLSTAEQHCLRAWGLELDGPGTEFRVNFRSLPFEPSHPYCAVEEA